MNEVKSLKQIGENKLSIGKKIGDGHLGDVFEGFLKIKNKKLSKNEKNHVKVAIKVKS